MLRSHSLENLPRLSKRKRFIRLLGWMSSLVLIGMSFYYSYGSRNAVLKSATQISQVMAQLTANHAESFMRGIVHIFNGLDDILSIHPAMGSPHHREIHLLLQHHKNAQPELMDLLVLDADGRIIHWTGPNTTPPQVNDRDYATAHLNTTAASPTAADLFIGEAKLSRVHKNQWFFGVSRAVYKHDGALDYILVAIVHANALQDVYAKSQLGERGTVLLAGQNGGILYRQPEFETLIGLHEPQIAEGYEWMRKTGKPKNIRLVSPLDGRKRIVSARLVSENIPMMVAVTLDENEVLADWRRENIMLALITSVAILVVLMLTARLLQGAGREENAVADLAKSEQRYRQLFQGNKAPELLISPVDGQIVDANEAAANFYGWSHDELLSKTINDINILNPEAVRMEMSAAHAENRDHFFFKHRLASGEVRDVEVRSGPIQIEERHLLYSIIHDVTDRRKAEEALLDAMRAAETATEAKSEFLANMSHELRTPLNSIIGFAQMMEYEIKGPLPTDYREYTQLITNSGRLLLETINGILDIAKIEAGKFELQTEDVFMGDLVNETVALMDIQAKEKGLQIVNTTHDLHHLHVDPMRVKQVLFNIIGNAIKFTDKGQVVVDSYCNVNGHHITVSDTGIGMHPEQIETAFEPFQQVHGTSLARKHQGTGLGLSFSRQVMRLHGGDLTAISTPGEGTTITLRFAPEAGKVCCG